MVLAVPASLGAFVAEDRAEVVEAHRLGEVVHPVFKVGAAHGGSPFRTQGQQVTATVGEGIRLFLYNVGARAYERSKSPELSNTGVSRREKPYWWLRLTHVRSI